jgi:predicted glycoside hydrolase/deacetylase ChbG (UPF0249 family)
MVLRPGAVDAARRARGHPGLSVGLHFDDDESDLDDPRTLERAFARQLGRFRKLMGRDPTHVDSHHHVHLEGDRLEHFARLVAPLAVPVRGDGRIAYIGGFYAQWEWLVTNLEYVSPQFLDRLLREEVTQPWTELACHPGRVVGDFDSEYLHEREAELATLTEPGLRARIADLGIELAGFAAWR